MESNPDTRYKRDVAKFFEEAGDKGRWQQLGEDFKDHIFQFQILDEARFSDSREAAAFDSPG